MLCVLLFAALAVLPALMKGVPSNIDLDNHFRVALPFYESVRAGNLSPSWLAESNGGYGDVSFRFYPPAFFYLLSAARSLCGDWYAATLLVFLLLSISGALGAYLWAREFLQPQFALWAGVFYTIAPYHLNELYQAALLPEYAAGAVLPFTFLFVERVCRRGRAQDVGALALSYSALIFTHLPLTVIGSLALCFYALLRIERAKLWATLLKLSFAVLLGLIATACYWTTMVAELGWINGTDPAADYRQNFLFSSFSADDASVWWVSIIALCTVALFAPALAHLRRTHDESFPARGVKALALLLLFSLLIATPLARPLWDHFRPLREVQYPWRWLAVSSLAGALLVSTSSPGWLSYARSKQRPLALLMIGCVLLSLTFSSAHIMREAQYLSQEKFASLLRSLPGTPCVSLWFPIWAVEPLREMSGDVEAGQRAVVINEWQPERRVFHVEAGAAATARVRTFYYPLWVATANGKPLETHPSRDGALLISLPADAATVQLELREPLRTRISSIVSVVGWALIVALLLWEFFRKRNATRASSEYEF
ncbi:MAG: hypothetical protein AUG51_23720 [Acidobacteria bacterium 13_1_20CM_3_53_8]|nr:MAG: hypothetical protein AUG51_23720 [Acidobacteria bacterium 13_1_20CM_3_53_8]